ncbi:AbrB family transcriptional regulator [Tritonibacter horizontis]|uniref:Putative ammonia monooxygenase n=1 Tax=Tritonibacter horizontis TaxID=1768241 RepID=A0A132BSV5_9RHOB|nr:AbrB family transcriptional regulator [Tritonibacter horizontis]KUP91479.1 putative ammonia monooxygenase [Tritonibacter horizontis]
MTAREGLGLVAAFAVALLGTVIFDAIGFPSAPLTGSAAAVSLAAVAGVPVHVPVWLRTTAFVLLGINIGSSVTYEMLQTALTWPVTIAILSLSLFVSLKVSASGLRRWMGFSGRDAVLAAAPGHLSYVLALSLSARGETARVAVVQSIRVLFLTLCVPVLVAKVFGASGLVLLAEAPLPLWQLFVLIGVTLAVGLVFTRLKVPAAYLLAGILCSGTGHVFDLTPGPPPESATFVAFLVMGILIGSRFVGQSLAGLRLDLLAGLWVTGTNVVITLLAIILSMSLLGLPPALLIVAFAPGGVEAMAAIAVTLGLDPAFVAAHHVMRLLILTLLIPLLLRRSGGA